MHFFHKYWLYYITLDACNHKASDMLAAFILFYCIYLDSLVFMQALGWFKLPDKISYLRTFPI